VLSVAAAEGLMAALRGASVTRARVLEVEAVGLLLVLVPRRSVIVAAEAVAKLDLSRGFAVVGELGAWECRLRRWRWDAIG